MTKEEEVKLKPFVKITVDIFNEEKAGQFEKLFLASFKAFIEALGQ